MCAYVVSLSVLVFCFQFQLQFHHYKALLQLILINPSQLTSNFQQLVMFLSQVSCNLCHLLLHSLVLLLQVCNCYSEEMKEFPGELQSLLLQHSSVLHPELRLVSVHK